MQQLVQGHGDVLVGLDLVPGYYLGGGHFITLFLVIHNLFSSKYICIICMVNTWFKKKVFWAQAHCIAYGNKRGRSCT